MRQHALKRRWIPVVVIATLAMAGVGYAALSPPDYSPYVSREIAPSDSKDGQLRVRYMGVTTLLFDDGANALIVDGFFSRPGLGSLSLRKISPDHARIEEALNRGHVASLHAVLVAHSHHDHAMDAPIVAGMKDADLVGSSSVAMMASGYPGKKPRMTVVRGGETLRYGPYKVTVFKSPHAPCALHVGNIGKPVRPPVRSSAYQGGDNFSYLVEHEGRRILVHPSANARPGMYQGVKADVVLLGIGTLGWRDKAFIDGYWENVVIATEASLVVPIHWDDFTKTAGTSFPPAPFLLGDFRGGMHALDDRARNTSVRVLLPSFFKPMDLLEHAR
ncbi:MULTISPECIES: MBL fold metallo-hydrolase [unclassified Pseudoxanthomonas]|uniref:MBL fold metallo-hydrolase n=1 Tax=unclassified Pseudoxanthomonas TaxID=2645906 RepID=UPI00307F56E0